MSSREDMANSEQRSSSSSILDHFASTYASQGSSSSSGDDVKCKDKDKVDENPFEYDPLTQRAVPTPTPTPTLTPVPTLAGSTPFKPLSRSTYSSSSALLQSEKKDDKNLAKRPTRDGDAKATVTDFLPHQPTTSESEKTKAGRDEKRAEKGREKARGRSKSDCTALSTSFKLSKLGQEKGRLGAALGVPSDTPLFSTDSIDGTPTKRKRVKLAELAARGFDSAQLLDFGASSAFGKLQRKQDGSHLPQLEREFDADKERDKEKEKEKEREREREKAKKKDQNVLVDSDLAELLMRPARLSESSLPRGDRDREKDRDKLRRKRAGTVGSGGRIDGKTVWDPSKHPYPYEDGDSSKNVPAFPTSTSTTIGTSSSGKESANSTSANTAANRQHGAPSTDNLKGQSTSLRYFMLELVDPQLNFLDTKSHSSLIMVAGRSSLEGQR